MKRWSGRAFKIIVERGMAHRSGNGRKPAGKGII
jgi:hypothetical protein